MALSTVAAQLKAWADAATLKARKANDPDSIAALEKAAQQFRDLMAQVESADAELDETKQRLAAAPAPKPVRRRGIGATEFWRREGVAVQAIISVYGLNWKTRAPFGETTLVTVPGWCRSTVGSRGGLVTWSKDHRVPAARYWPDERIPDGMEISEDYERVWSGYGPPDAPRAHDDAWHVAHGYVWDGMHWRQEIEVRNSLNREEAIADYKEAKRAAEIAAREARRLAKLVDAAYSYGPQPANDDEQQKLAAE